MADCSYCVRKIPYFHLKLHFFLFNGALACVIPYLPVHAKEIGISAVSVGIIYCMLPLITMVLKPLFCALADHFDNLKTMLIVFLGVIMLTSTLTVTIPRKQNLIGSEVRCSASGTNLHFDAKPSQDCMMNVLVSKPLQCYMYCTECVEFKPANNSKNQTCVKKVMHPAQITLNLEKKNDSTHVFAVKEISLSEREMNTLCFVNLTFSCNSYCEPVLQECFTGKSEPEYTSDQFWLFLIFATICVSFCGIATSFSDAICFNELGENGHLYGQQRLWGTIGWGFLSPLAGFLNDLVTGDSFLKAYQPGAIVQILILLPNLCIVNKLKTKHCKFSQSIIKDVGSLFRQFKVLVFILAVVVIGSFTALIWSFLFWHLLNKGASKILLGIVPAVQCFLGELVFFFFSGQLITKFGHLNVILLALICFVFRFYAYANLSDPWMVLPVELLQGPTYGLFYATMASFAHYNALPGTEVTVQGVVGAAFELGMCIGNLVGGILTQANNTAYTFFCAYMAAETYCLIHIILTLISKCIDWEKRRREAEREAAAHAPVEELRTFM